jgi:hypothetical protein
VGTPAAVAATFASLVLATAGSASAAPGNGVHVDPGSPAGKQYAIPIPSARAETSGQSGGTGSANPPLFGVGVTPAGTAATGGASGAAASAGQSTSVRSPATTAQAADGKSRRLTARQGTRADTLGAPRMAAPSGGHLSAQSSAVGGTSWLPLLGGGALVLLIGGGGGFLLRRSL